MADEEERKVLQDMFLKLWCYSGAYGHLQNTVKNPWDVGMAVNNFWKKSSYVPISQVLDTQNVNQSMYHYQHLSLKCNVQIKSPHQAQHVISKSQYFYQNMEDEVLQPQGLPYFSTGQEIIRNGGFSKQMIGREDQNHSYKCIKSTLNSQYTKQILQQPRNLIRIDNALRKASKGPTKKEIQYLKPSHNSTNHNKLQVPKMNRVLPNLTHDQNSEFKNKEEKRQRTLIHVLSPTDPQTSVQLPWTSFPHQNIQKNQDVKNEEHNVEYEQTEPLDLSKHVHVSVCNAGRKPDDNDNCSQLTNPNCYIGSINSKENTKISQSTISSFSNLAETDTINEENIQLNGHTNNNGYINRKIDSNGKHSEINDFLSRKIIEYNWGKKRKIQRKRFKMRKSLKKMEYIEKKHVAKVETADKLERSNATTDAQSTQKKLKRLLTDECVNIRDQHLKKTENKSCSKPYAICSTIRENIQESNEGQTDMLDEIIPTKNVPQNICTLSEDALKDGLRVLLRQDGLFYPGKLSNIVPPDIYGILVDKERGSKPHVLSREQVISEAILDIRPPTVEDLKLGTRVCAFWSSKMTCLHPGTIVGHELKEGFVIVHHENYPLFEKNLSLAAAYPTLIMMRKMQNESIHTQTIKKTVRKIKDAREALKSKCYTKENKLKTMPSKSKRTRKSYLKSSKQSFSPQPNQTWSWYDEGRKLSAKSQNVNHDTIQNDAIK